ncbi:MAG TPA: hypothetical protein VNT56_08440 [Acidimicrobiales bacterium]|nr:hypothetical protein [Acidimicrobiales bacterium]
MAWAPLFGATVASVGLLWALLHRNPESTASTLAGLRLAALLMSTGAAFALEDPAASTLASSPTGLRARQGLRLGLLLLTLAALWTAVAAAAAVLAGVAPSALPLGAATLEAVAMLAVALAVTAAASRTADGRGGVTGSSALLLAMLAALLGQQRWPRHLTVFPFEPSDPAWELAHTRWFGVLVGAVVVLAAACSDPARRPLAQTGLVPPRNRQRRSM